MPRIFQLKKETHKQCTFSSCILLQRNGVKRQTSEKGINISQCALTTVYHNKFRQSLCVLVCGQHNEIKDKNYIKSRNWVCFNVRRTALDI